MYLDAHAAKALSAGNAIVIQGCPGLRLEAAASAKSWVYRYKSLVDGRMRQVEFWTWPSTCFTDVSKPLPRRQWKRFRVMWFPVRLASVAATNTTPRRSNGCSRLALGLEAVVQADAV